MTRTNNKEHLRALLESYRDTRRKQLDKIKDSFKTSLPHHRYRIDCPCGKEITLHNLIIHYCGKKHRAVCGDLDSDINQ
jgi:hypothetical protein